MSLETFSLCRSLVPSLQCTSEQLSVSLVAHHHQRAQELLTSFNPQLQQLNSQLALAQAGPPSLLSALLPRQTQVPDSHPQQEKQSVGLIPYRLSVSTHILAANSLLTCLTPSISISNLPTRQCRAPLPPSKSTLDHCWQTSRGCLQILTGFDNISISVGRQFWILFGLFPSNVK